MSDLGFCKSTRRRPWANIAQHTAFCANSVITSMRLHENNVEAGSTSFDRYEKYKTAKTVREAQQETGIKGLGQLKPQYI